MNITRQEMLDVLIKTKRPSGKFHLHAVAHELRVRGFSKDDADHIVHMLERSTRGNSNNCARWWASLPSEVQS